MGSLFGNKPSGIQLISQDESKTRRNFRLKETPHNIIANKLMEYKILRNIPGAKIYLKNENILNEWVKKERIVIEKNKPAECLAITFSL